MQSFEINSSKDKEPIKINYFPNKYKHKLIIIVGGWGDTRNEFLNIVTLLVNKGINESFTTFSFRGYEDKKYRPLLQQSKDLKEVVEYFIGKKNITEIKLINTSDGAVSSTYLLFSDDFGDSINKAIYLDPADYYQESIGKLTEDIFIWPGFKKFEPTKKVVADLLTKVKSDVMVDVVNFTLRNYGPDGYSPHPSVDNPNYFPRLNNDMVRNFYEKTPKKNRGKYMEIPGIPHAFLRDGNVKENEIKVADLIFKLVKDS